jgi:hypothetical protein
MVSKGRTLIEGEHLHCSTEVVLVLLRGVLSSLRSDSSGGSERGLEVAVMGLPGVVMPSVELVLNLVALVEDPWMFMWVLR